MDKDLGPHWGALTGLAIFLAVVAGYCVREFSGDVGRRQECEARGGHYEHKQRGYLCTNVATGVEERTRYE